MRKLKAFTITYFTLCINLAISTAYLFSTYIIVLTFDFFVVYIEFHIVTVFVAFVVYYASLLLCFALLFYIVAWNYKPPQVVLTHHISLIPSIEWYAAPGRCTWAWYWLNFKHEIFVHSRHRCKVKYAVWPRFIASQLHYQLWVSACQALPRRIIDSRIILYFIQVVLLNSLVERNPSQKCGNVKFLSRTRIDWKYFGEIFVWFDLVLYYFSDDVTSICSS